MIKLSSIYLLVFLVNMSVYFAQTEETIEIASVGSYKIYSDEFRERMLDFMVFADMPDSRMSRKSIIMNLVAERLLYYFDDNTSIINNPEYIKEQEWNKSQSVLAFLKDREVHAKITVTEEETRETYIRMNSRYAARHLFAYTKEEAERLHTLLLNGSSFELLAKQCFTDTLLRDNGGFIGYFTFGEMDPAFEDKVFEMKIGEVSAPVRTAYGYSIIRLDDAVTRPLLNEEEYTKNKSQIEYELRVRKKGLAERSFIEKVFNPAEAVFNNKSVISVWNRLFGTGGTLESGKDKTLYSECVKYHGVSYSQAEIESAIENLPVYQKNKIKNTDALTNAVLGIILNKKLTAMALEKGYDNHPAVIKRISERALSLFIAKKKENILSNAVVSDEEAKAFYDNKTDIFTTPVKYEIKEIMLDDRISAEKCADLLKSGKSFEETLKLAGEEYLGYTGSISAEDLGKYLEYFKGAKKGTVVGPINMDGSFGVYKVFGVRDAETPDFADIREVVKKYLVQKNQSRYFNDYIEKLKDKAVISINEDAAYNLVLIEN